MIAFPFHHKYHYFNWTRLSLQHISFSKSFKIPVLWNFYNYDKEKQVPTRWFIPTKSKIRWNKINTWQTVDVCTHRGDFKKESYINSVHIFRPVPLKDGFQRLELYNTGRISVNNPQVRNPLETPVHIFTLPLVSPKRNREGFVTA